MVEKFLRNRGPGEGDRPARKIWQEGRDGLERQRHPLGRILNLLLQVPRDRAGIGGFAGRVLVWVGLSIWGILFLAAGVDPGFVNSSFLHSVNLPFHEAGHLFFSIFGRFLGSLGGTLGQLLVPLACLLAFILKRRDNFAASVCLWWIGQNLVDISPYIRDARAGVLPLIGGNTGQTAPYGFHDWNYLLNEVGLLGYDHQLATLAHLSGTLVMLLSVLWAGILLWGEFGLLPGRGRGSD